MSTILDPGIYKAEIIEINTKTEVELWVRILDPVVQGRPYRNSHSPTELKAWKPSKKTLREYLKRAGLLDAKGNAQRSKVIGKEVYALALVKKRYGRNWTNLYGIADESKKLERKLNNWKTKNPDLLPTMLPQVY